MSNKGLQTGMPAGTYKWGDQHPSIEDRVFKGYQHNSPSTELWFTKESLKLTVKKTMAKRVKSKAIRYNTGSAKGTYQKWEEHPTHKGMFLSCYKMSRHGKLKEYWVNKERMEKIKLQATFNRTKRRQIEKSFNLSDGDKAIINDFYKIRNIKNKSHGKAMYHVDHIVPIAKGGMHHQSNLQIATATWNLSKGSRMLNTIDKEGRIQG